MLYRRVQVRRSLSMRDAVVNVAVFIVATTPRRRGLSPSCPCNNAGGVLTVYVRDVAVIAAPCCGCIELLVLLLVG